MKGLDSALVRLFGAGDRRQRPPLKGSVAFLGGGRRRLDDRSRIGRIVQRGLLLVEHVSAQVLGSLVVVELCLVGVAAILRETQFSLTSLGRGDRDKVIRVGCRVAIKRRLCFIKALLVTIGPDLFAFGDALIQVDKRLFLIKFTLLSGE